MTSLCWQDSPITPQGPCRVALAAAPRDLQRKSRPRGCISHLAVAVAQSQGARAHAQLCHYASFCISAGLRGLALPRPDVIIATSPQLLVAVSEWWLGFARQLPFVFEVRDLWPESLTAVGMGDENSLLHHGLAAVARFLYERADRVVVVTPAFKQHLIQRWRVPEEEISVVENEVESDLFAPQI